MASTVDQRQPDGLAVHNDEQGAQPCVQAQHPVQLEGHHALAIGTAGVLDTVCNPEADPQHEECECAYAADPGVGGSHCIHSTVCEAVHAVAACPCSPKECNRVGVGVGWGELLVQCSAHPTSACCMPSSSTGPRIGQCVEVCAQMTSSLTGAGLVGAALDGGMGGGGHRPCKSWLTSVPGGAGVDRGRQDPAAWQPRSGHQIFESPGEL